LTLRPNALWACLLLASTSFAQSTHTIRPGDQIGKLAEKYRVTSRSILQANPGLSAERLKLGAKIRIPKRTASNALPGTSAPTAAAPARSSSTTTGRTLSVRSGDHIDKLAERAGVPNAALRAANPGVQWDKLRIGQQIRIPSSRQVASARPATTTVRTASTTSRSVTVRQGDNDWVIARRVGVTPSQLRAANPNVRWDRLQIGQKLNLPGGARVATAQIASIRTARAMVIKDDATIRRGAKTTAPAITTVDRGTEAVVLDRMGDWYKLRFPRGTVGWMRGDMLKGISARQVASTRTRTRSSQTVAQRTRTSSSSKTRTVASREPSPSSGYALIDKAKSHMGVRYRWGGTSRSGFDCSGFTTSVFRSQGIRLPRTSREQARVGTAVSKSNLKQGDLVFFKTNRGTRINHVGIYIGGGRFIHASSGGGRVKTDSINEGYYQRRYAGARRVTSNLKPSSTASRSKSSTVVAQTSSSAKSSRNDAPQSRRRVSLGTDEVSR